MQALALEPGRYGAGAVSRRLRRPALALAVTALALAVTGDRSRAAGVPAGITGQDPLEVLELKVRPNVILVLDTSSSMLEIQDKSRAVQSGDHPRSKIYQGKKVIRDLIALNQNNVSFQLGTYSAYQPELNHEQAGFNRFQYITGTMPTPELTIRGAVGDTLGRGLQSWQMIYPQQGTVSGWNTLYYEEAGVTCVAQLALGPGPNGEKFYAQGGKATTAAADIAGSLAADLKARMNSPTGCTRQNTYDVTYSVATGVFTFTRTAGTTSWRPLWSPSASRPNSIRGAFRAPTTDPAAGSGPFTTQNRPYTLLFRTTTGSGSAPFLGGLSTEWTFDEQVPPSSTNLVRFYQAGASRLWNGETIRVSATGEACGMDFATAATRTKVAQIVIQAADASCNPTGNSARFDFAGANIRGTAGLGCGGYREKSALVPCDLRPPAPLQMEQTAPLLDAEIPIDASGLPADWDGDGTRDYGELMDGTWATDMATLKIGPSLKWESSTPIANTLIDLKGTANGSDNSCVVSVNPVTDAPTLGPCPERGFTKLWNQGQAGTTNMAGPPPWQLDPIKNHKDPKEKTIVLFVTDGADTCPNRPASVTGFSSNARRAAFYAEELYRRIDPAQPASSVSTYLLGYGYSSTTSLDMIAWAGTGLGQGGPGQPDVDWKNDSTSTIAAKRAQCTTCVDAFAAPDAVTLAAQLQSIIDQGASDGDFNAQQSITESVFEYVHLAATGTVFYDAATPSNRYSAIVPTRFISAFSLPGFKGQLKAFHNDGTGGTITRWSAGDVLFNQVSDVTTGMGGCDTTGQGGGPGWCTFDQLHGGASVTDATIRTSAARIKRRIYTTSGNGVFPYTVQRLVDGTTTDGPTTGRVALWPPTAAGLLHSGVTDNSYKGYDGAFGLPPNSPTSFPPNPVDEFCDPNDTLNLPKKAFDQCWLEWLQKKFQACMGTSLPSACTSGTFATKMVAARREAREIALAFMAGAATVPADAPPGGIRRAAGSLLLYRARGWILGDSELATAAVVTPPLPSEPTATPYLAEYQVFRDGPRVGGTNAERSAGAAVQVKMGFGLRNPDNDGSASPGAADSNIGLKPVMTVVYSPANDMLHAFRAGPCRTPALSTPPCNELGGEELWGFIPFDQLHAVMLRAAFEPQGRANHVFMLARGARFSDIFVPGTFSRTIGGATVSSTQGAWRRILFIGRGIGGKYMTALDVTGPGPFTEYALDTRPPEPLWSRGNPDTKLGLGGGGANGTATELTAYSKMGETWSIPVVAYVDKTNPIYVSTQNPGGLDYVLFMGSGYGNTSGCPAAPCEGQTFYTLDALSGDVVATADVGSRAGFVTYPNALVANAVGFNPKAFSLLKTIHPAANIVTRVYIGDLHGRLWKFLTSRPDLALQVADVGADQPIATAVSLLGLPPQPSTPVPHIYVTSGADRRAAGPFQMFAFKDPGTDTDTALGAGITDGTVTTFQPAVSLFKGPAPIPLGGRFFDQGTPDGECGYTTEAVFRGTVQPATAFECSSISGGVCNTPVGRVFFSGTRLSVPNTRFAPITPLACGAGDYPCRSQFDSIIYALGALTGLAAYDLNASGDDAYRIFRDSRIAALTVQADPDPGRGGSSLTPDEGLIKGVPKPPPPIGVPPTTTTATTNVVMAREAGQPAPAIRFGTTVCQ